MSLQADRQSWNYRVFLAQGICVDIAQNLASPRLVLPFLYLALGAPALLAALLVPMVQVCRLIGQVLSAPLISVALARKWYMVAGIAAIGGALAVAGLAAELTTSVTVAVTFIAAAVVIGLGQAVNRLAFQHMLGDFAKTRRRSLLYAQTAISGIVTIAVAWTSLHIFSDSEPLNTHMMLLWTGVVVCLLAAFFSMALRETGTSVSDPNQGEAIDSSADYVRKTCSEIAQAVRLVWFRRFLQARFLFLSIELAMPFYAIHAAEMHADARGTLSIFVIAASLGLIVGGPVWRRLSLTSIKGVMIAGCLLAMAGGCVAVAVEQISTFDHAVVYAVVFFAISAADQGIQVARKVYVVELAPLEQRAYFIAAGDSLIGLIGIGFAFALGALAHLHEIAMPIYVLTALNLAAIASVMLLPTAAEPTAAKDSASNGAD